MYARRYWLCLTLIAAVLMAGATLPATAPTGVSEAAAKGPRATLERGDRGPRVRTLQRKLGVPADGVFGPGTARALRRYQRRKGLMVDGVAGSQTLRSLGIRSRRSAAPRKRSSGGRRGSSRRGDVRRMQRKIGVPADGVFGPQTARALRRWQRRKGLTADGIAGPQTRSALGLGAGPVLKRRGGGGGGGPGNGDRYRSVVRRVIAAGNRIARTPYLYGGGHGSFNDSGYDCSGSMSYALHGGGLLRTPLDSTGFMSYGRPGPGRFITIYANAGHSYMVVNGRRFDTSARAETGSRWTDEMRSSAGYTVRHPAGL